VIFLKQLHEDNEPEQGKKFLRFDRELDGASFGPM
jgi:hypothetical protein